MCMSVFSFGIKDISCHVFATRCWMKHKGLTKIN